jgi:hypothetical protein
MSNILRRRSKKNNKKHHSYNSWAFVILATLIDTIFRIGGKYAPGKSIFDLSSSLGPRGRKRQDLLAIIFLSIIEIALAVLIVGTIVAGNEDWIIAIVLFLFYSIFWVACLIPSIKGKKK